MWKCKCGMIRFRNDSMLIRRCGYPARVPCGGSDKHFDMVACRMVPLLSASLSLAAVLAALLICSVDVVASEWTGGLVFDSLRVSLLSTSQARAYVESTGVFQRALALVFWPDGMYLCFDLSVDARALHVSPGPARIMELPEKSRHHPR